MARVTAGRLLAILVAGVIPFVMAPQLAHAGGKKPPRSYLRDGERRLQRGKLGSYCWVTGGEGMCVDALPAWPKRDRVGSDEKLRIRFRKKQKPTTLSLTTFKKVKNNGLPKGDGRRAQRRLERVKVDGETIGWKAIFSVPKPGRHYYISAFVRWDEGDASYSFHVKTRA
jgi:hypothetical protein